MGFREEFDALLSNTVIQGDLTDDQTKELYVPLIDFTLKNLPDYLYRYRSCNELNIEAFNSDSVWAVLPSEFNDAHDSLFYYNTAQILADLRNDFGSDGLLKVWDDSDKLAASTEMKNAKEIFRTRAKIACLCENKYSNTMWAHYADYHKGFLLEYDKLAILKAVTTNNQAKMFPVIYDGKRYDASMHIKWCLEKQIGFNLNLNVPVPIPIPDLLYPEKIFLHKAKEWENEDEWRLIHPVKSEEKNKAYELKNFTPSAIYYGAKISSDHKKILSLIAQKKGIAEYDICIDENSEHYKLIANISEPVM